MASTIDNQGQLEKLEGEQRQLQERLQQIRSKTDQVADFVPDLIGRFKTAVANLTTVTQYSVDKTRGTLRQLMGNEIVLHPTANGEERYLTAEVSGDYAGLYRLITGKNKFGGGQGS